MQLLRRETEIKIFAKEDLAKYLLMTLEMVQKEV